MEVKPGYKQTEVGIIPEDWKVGPLRQLISSVIDNRGKTPPLAVHGYPMIEVNAIYGTTRNPDFTKVNKFVGQQTYDKWFRRGHPKPNDILIATVGTAGASAIVGEQVGCIAQNVIGLRVSETQNASFIFQYTKTELFLSQVRAVLMGAVQPSLKVPHLLEFLIPYAPTQVEQRAIAQALSDVDSLLDGLDRLIAKKRDLKQATMQQLLTGQTRLPGFDAVSSTKHTEIGEIPKDWNLECIENFANITTGSKNTEDHVEDGQYPFFVRSQKVERINTYSFDGEAVLTAGDGVGTGKVFHYINGKFDVHQRVYRISDFSEHVSGYFFYLYFSTRFYSRIMQMTAKSSVDSVRREMIARMLIPLPATKVEQTAIAEVLIDIDAEIAALEQRREKSRALKQAMMQELLTGKTRLI